MLKLAEKLNKSRRLNALINYLSVRLAGYRGIPVLFGVVLTVISLVVHLIAAATNHFDSFYVAGTILLHIAVFVGLLGVLLAEPLGKG
jgi:hypothetical protein